MLQQFVVYLMIISLVSRRLLHGFAHEITNASGAI